MIQPNSFSHDPEWAEGAAVDAATIRRAHAKNCTLVLHNVELYWRPVALLSLSLSRLFGVYSQANVYYSPPALAAALHAHQDAQSVFIVQCEGRKTWTLLEPPVRWKLRCNQRG
jgi:ribosomal protein L16 Arg81 hydroxylase